jgi:hypothetical protein
MQGTRSKRGNTIQNLGMDRTDCTRSTKEGVEAWYLRHLKPTLESRRLFKTWLRSSCTEKVFLKVICGLLVG